MKKKGLLRLLGLFILVFFFVQLFLVPKRYINSEIVQALQAPRFFLNGFSRQNDLINSIKNLEKENLSLRLEVLRLEDKVNDEHQGYIFTNVFSKYPYNDNDRLVIDAGLNDGVVTGMTVNFQPGVFLGEVVSALENRAEVRTIFDPGWELPVRIGEDGVDALLIGGHQPRLTLISKSKEIKVDDRVYVADKEFVYGLTIGFIDRVLIDDKEVFYSAKIRIPYQRSEIKEVFILRNE
ncbi:MAG: hypothetical protein COU06_01490 [Candidatus Harrisonbacteria bacterium CG10_big_fil_rev_8_21_14_0_10_38_8]|uniref:Cell shape-determining protein MreC n=1 Tax=Candidatus Harrisonbacteria bacterium CG10_big_fil_rev_8_21_14_0_10_38_8 TaxID=1974582 RepID=A0A2M6WK25_9BACT|nr:MAG: hypothetical protein COU06_01490 [Candidatus Harrisonbacteria bacterium CG10_big_fil_rev_8_21_14_0_10_38_8]